MTYFLCYAAQKYTKKIYRIKKYHQKIILYDSLRLFTRNFAKNLVNKRPYDLVIRINKCKNIHYKPIKIHVLWLNIQKT